MKRVLASFIKSAVIILICSGALAATLQAQSYAITVKVPFPFTVGTQTLEPGTYQFSLVSSRVESDQFLLSMLNIKTFDTEMFTVRPEQQRTIERHGHLIFHKFEGRRTLAEVHFPGSYTFSELIQRRRVERVETTRTSTSESVSVAQR